MDEKQDRPLRIQKVNVEKLFGRFSYTIQLDRRVTIIHGPNGYGKTTVLRMIASLFSHDFSIFRRSAFGDIAVFFDDGSILRITHAGEAKRITPRGKMAPTKRGGRARPPSSPLELSFELTQGGQTTHLDGAVGASDDLLRYIDGLVPHPYRLRPGERMWRNVETGDLVSLAHIVRRHPNLLHRFQDVGIDPESVLAEPRAPLERLLSRIKGHFIETKRLDARGGHSYEDEHEVRHGHEAETTGPRLKVTEYSRDIVQRAKAVLAQYAKHSQQLDRSFPARLVAFAKEEAPRLHPQEILDRLSELDKKRAWLTQVGLLDKEPGLEGLTLEDVVRAQDALHIYVNDVKDKLSVFDSTARRVGLLVEIINSHLLYKELNVSREEGFIVTTRDQTPVRLPVEDLSSGEQNELVVLYEMLFRVEHGGTILIDEPEISLHVAWQIGFLKDLDRVLEAIDGRALVATHSPNIVNGNWDIAVDLEKEAVGATQGVD